MINTFGCTGLGEIYTWNVGCKCLWKGGQVGAAAPCNPLLLVQGELMPKHHDG